MLKYSKKISVDSNVHFKNTQDMILLNSIHQLLQVFRDIISKM